MKTKLAPAVMVVAIGLTLAFAFAWTRHGDSKTQSWEEPAVEKIPPLPPGVTELKFGDFFATPVGPRGLEFSEKLRSLDGQHVRMLGYMVRREGGLPGKFLFTAIPVQLHDHDSALADDLPPATVCVSVPTCRERVVPYVPGLMLLTGTLSVGPREEADGRISVVRLALDPPARDERTDSVFSKGGSLASSHRSSAR